MVGVAKKGWTVVSHDEGKTFSPPVLAESVVTDSAKVWVQKTSDGRYAMLYNPHVSNRYPLVALTSEDGEKFEGMRVINGDVPLQRYVGMNRTPGDQYMRGVSIFANDRSRKEKEMFVAYSANKEDIWVARIPVPLVGVETEGVADRFDSAAGDVVPGWNTYSPLWAPVAIGVDTAGGKGLRLMDRDPHDFAKAVREFPESKLVTVSFTLTVEQPGLLECELRPAFGEARPVRLTLPAEGKVIAGYGDSLSAQSGTYVLGKPMAVTIVADCGASSYTISLNGKQMAAVPFAGHVESLAQLEFRTGELRAAPARATVSVENDRPLDVAASFLIQDVTIK